MSEVRAALVESLQFELVAPAAPVFASERARRAAAIGGVQVYYGRCEICADAEVLPGFDPKRSPFPRCSRCGERLTVFVCLPEQQEARSGATATKEKAKSA